VGSEGAGQVVSGAVCGFSGLQGVSGEQSACTTDDWGYEVDFDEHKLFEHGLRAVDEHRHERAEKLRKNLEKAQAAARCQHEHVNGNQCRAPRVKDGKLCHMHQRLEEAKSEKLDLGPMEDPDSIQVGIKKLQGAIIEGTLDARQVGQLAYTIQLAAWNVGRMTAKSST
jgi:hypothetical protein